MATMTGTADYQATKTFQSVPATVFDALTRVDAITGWWAPATGSAVTGSEIVLDFGGQEVRIRVEQAEPVRVCWRVQVSEPLPDWTGTTITFDFGPAGDGGTSLRFTHHGLTPQLECFSACQAGWIQYLASLVDYVDHGGGNAFGSATDERAAAWREHQAHAAG